MPAGLFHRWHRCGCIAGQFNIAQAGQIVASDCASDFNLALTTLCDRLDFSTNNNGDPVTCAELRALAHISSTANALIQQVRYGLRAEIAVGEQA